MPRMDGMETLRRLRQKSDMPVIFLTSKDEEIDELFGLKMGADDFIRKPFSQRLLVERVKAVLRRVVAEGRHGAEGSRFRQGARARPVAHGPGAPHLHLEERAGHAHGHRVPHPAGAGDAPGRGEEPQRLMDAAYDDQVYVDDRTIDSHIKRLRKKFKQTDDDFDMIETLYGVGYRFKEA